MRGTVHVDAQPPVVGPASSAAQTVAYVLSSTAALLMATASVVGVSMRGFYTDIPWAAEAFRGGDLISLLLTTPLLIAAMIVTARGSYRARLMWAGALGYTTHYTYAYVVFGAEFNDLFLVHMVILSAAIWALICRCPRPTYPPLRHRSALEPPRGWFRSCSEARRSCWPACGTTSASSRLRPAVSRRASSPAALHMRLRHRRDLLRGAAGGRRRAASAAHRLGLRPRHGDGRDGRGVPGQSDVGGGVPGARPRARRRRVLTGLACPGPRVRRGRRRQCWRR